MSYAEQPDKDHQLKFHNQKAIGLACFLGAPLAASLLIRRNYLNMGQENHARTSLLLGILSSLLIFAGIFALPDAVIDRIPNMIIPGIYTGIIYLLVERLMGSELDAHKGANRPFYSLWKAAGTGFASLALILTFVFALIWFQPDDFDTVRYDQGIDHISQNEESALALFDMVETASEEEILFFIERQGLPLWEENLKILEELEAIERLPEILQQQNSLLQAYFTLRLQSYQLIAKSIREESPALDQEIWAVQLQIEAIIDQLHAN